MSSKGIWEKKKRNTDNQIRYPAHRDHRRYVDVLLGKRDGVSSPKEKEEEISHAQVSFQIFLNQVMVDRLKYAAVLELNALTTIEHVASLVNDTNIPFVCISYLSPSKLIMFFDDELSLRIAMEETSPLRKLFTDVRRWSEGECYRERLVWIECVGLHPKC